MNLVLFIFSCFHLIYLNEATWTCEEVFELEKILPVNPRAPIPQLDQSIPIRYLGIGNSIDFGDASSTPPCQLINYNKDECGGISVKGNFAYNNETGTAQYVYIMSQNKDKTIGWTTKLLIKRISNTLHTYKMTWVETTSYSIPKNPSERQKAILLTAWNQKFFNRYNGTYAMVDSENNMAAFAMCMRDDRPFNDNSTSGPWGEYDPFFIQGVIRASWGEVDFAWGEMDKTLLHFIGTWEKLQKNHSDSLIHVLQYSTGAWVTIPKEDPVEYRTLVELSTKFARYKSPNLNFISDTYDADE